MSILALNRCRPPHVDAMFGGLVVHECVIPFRYTKAFNFEAAATAKGGDVGDGGDGKLKAGLMANRKDRARYVLEE